MPLYEYFCRTCNTRFERLRSMADADAPIACPECKTENTVRALSVVVMHSGGSRSESASSAASSSESHSSGHHCCGGACGCGH